MVAMNYEKINRHQVQYARAVNVGQDTGVGVASL